MKKVDRITGQGVVTAWDPERGYGLVTSDDGENVYLHRDWLSCRPENLYEGLRVKFVLASAYISPGSDPSMPRMRRAVNVMPVDLSHVPWVAKER